MSKVINGYCIECGNDPKGDEPCPGCGRVKAKLNLHAMNDFESERFLSRAKTLGVPQHYLANMWSPEVFWRNHPDYIDGAGERDGRLSHYVNQLTAVYNIFARGDIPQQSGLIISPSTFGKSVWAFSCMQQALNHGYTVAPLLTTLEAQRLLVMGAHRADFKFGGKISFDDYVFADVMFISVSKLEYYKQAFAIIEEIAAMRSNKGLGYFILSERNERELCEWENGAPQFLKMFREGAYENNLKYPVKVTFEERVFQ